MYYIPSDRNILLFYQLVFILICYKNIQSFNNRINLVGYNFLKS